MDDFFTRALLGGIGVALAAGPVGCFIVWRRMVYFGAALAHSALLGVALGFLLGVDLTVGIVALCVLLAVLFVLLERQHLLPTDTLLGVLAHVTLAAGLVVVAFLTGLRVDLMGYLFGDILAVTDRDLAVILVLAIVTLTGMALMWRSLLSITVSEDLAAVEEVALQHAGYDLEGLGAAGADQAEYAGDLPGEHRQRIVLHHRRHLEILHREHARAGRPDTVSRPSQSYRRRL